MRTLRRVRIEFEGFHTVISTWFRGGRLASVGAVVFAGVVTAQDLAPRWTHASDSEAWVPRQVGLGNEGGDVMAQLTGADLHRRLIAFGDSVPVWQQSDEIATARQRVASAASVSAHASLRDEPITGSPGSYRVLVRLHVNDGSPFAPGSTPPLPFDATFELAERTSGHDNLVLVATADGRKFAAVVLEDSTATNVATVFTPGVATPLRRPLSLFGPVIHARISNDGSRLLAASQMQFCVTDLASGETLLSAFFTQPLERGVALSSDGGLAAIGLLANLRVHRITSAGSSVAWTYTAPAGSQCFDTEFSADGSTLAASFFGGSSGNEVSVVWFDVAASNAAGVGVVRATRVAASGGTLADRPADLAISADGSVTALGLWGDDGASKPEVVVWREGLELVTRTIQLPGSPQRIDLSPDGLRLVVGSKARHNTVWASGGRIDLYDVGAGDIGYRGAPRRGHAIDVDVRGEPLRPARLLLASRLATTPVERAGLGTLFLDRMALIDVVPLGTTDASGELVAPFSIPSSWPVGSPVYLQGMTLAPARLTESWVKFTVLP